MKHTLLFNMTKNKRFIFFIILAISISGFIFPSNSTVVYAQTTGDIKTIQDALKNKAKESSCIKFCFAEAINAKDNDAFKKVITFTDPNNQKDIGTCISSNTYEGAACMITAGEGDLLGKLRAYVNNPTSDNLNDVLTWLNTEHPLDILTPAAGIEENPCSLPTSGWSWNPIDWIVGGLTFGFFIIVKRLLELCLGLFQFILNPSNFGGYIHFLNSTIVEALWKDFRNLANLGIVIAMIFTAIATILRIEKYSWKKMLPKLLIVALLVNFSLIISGIFVDVSNFISISASTKFSNIDLKTAVVDQTVCPVVLAFFHLKNGGGWPLLRASALGLVLSGILLFTFIGLTFYVFSRIVTIIICLITSPLAFLSFALPGGEKIWDFWRQRFQQAIVVLPILCITLYLSLRFISILIQNI
jgi:hypothetical protein